MPRPRGFKCFKCGCCCDTDVRDIPALRSFADRKGHCRYFDPETRLCQIFDQRPAVCNVKEFHDLEFPNVDWDDFRFTNMLNCVALRYMAGVPEPDDSPFKGRQEEIALRVMGDKQLAVEGKLVEGNADAKRTPLADEGDYDPYFDDYANITTRQAWWVSKG